MKAKIYFILFPFVQTQNKKNKPSCLNSRTVGALPTICSRSRFFLLYLPWLLITIPEHCWNENCTFAPVQEISTLDAVEFVTVKGAAVRALRAILRCVSSHASAYPRRLATLRWPVSWAAYSAGQPASSIRFTAVFLTEWLVRLPGIPTA